jgi:hypothetical protein
VGFVLRAAFTFAAPAPVTFLIAPTICWWVMLLWRGSPVMHLLRNLARANNISQITKWRAWIAKHS